MGEKEKLIPDEWLREGPQELVVRAAKLINSSDLTDVRRARKLSEMLLPFDINNAGIVFIVASSYMREQRYAYAEHWFRRCLQIKPDFAEAWNNLGFVVQQDTRRDEAADCFKKALELNPEQTEFYNNISTGYVNNGTPDEAIKWAKIALEKDPENQDAEWNMGLAYLEKGDWENGWKHYEAGLVPSINSSQRRKIRHYLEEGKVPYWNGETDGLIAVYGEQGVGDEILALSMLEEFSQRYEILYEAHPRLVDIARYSFEEKFPIYGTRKVPWRENHVPKFHDIKYKLPILSMAKTLRRKDSDFPRRPYLKPFPKLVEKYRKALSRMGPKPKIGISWKGGTNITNRDYRSISLQEWVPILKSADVDWISLQYDPAERPGWNTPIVEGFEKEHGINLNHDPGVINDLEESYAGLINALDLVITVNTSLVHACGAFGVPCWVLTPSRCAWRYGVEGEHMIWYGDHVRQIRQKGDDWDPVIEQLITELQAYVEERTAA